MCNLSRKKLTWRLSDFVLYGFHHVDDGFGERVILPTGDGLHF